VILATGAQAKWLGLPSEEASSRASASRPAPPATASSIRGKKVAVIGGGNTAVEEALYLTNHAEKVTLVHRRDELRAEKILQDRLFKHPKIEVIWDHVKTKCSATTMPQGRHRRAHPRTSRPARPPSSRSTACSSPSATPRPRSW
jgi:thioredoxin reductase (NADPH)